MIATTTHDPGVLNGWCLMTPDSYRYAFAPLIVYIFVYYILSSGARQEYTSGTIRSPKTARRSCTWSLRVQASWMYSPLRRKSRGGQSAAWSGVACRGLWLLMLQSKLWKLLFLTFSVLVANPKKLLYTVANPARGLSSENKKESGSAPPPPPRCSFGQNKIKIT